MTDSTKVHLVVSAVIISWSALVSALLYWLSPPTTPALALLALGALLIPATWIAAGTAGYWLAVAFDRFTGLGMGIPGAPIVNRHIGHQVVLGPTLLLNTALGIPVVWSFRNTGGQPVTPIDRSAAGIAIAGRPAGQDKGWYELKYVPGAHTYREARKRKAEARWIALKEIDLSEDAEDIQPTTKEASPCENSF
ncbi:MAG: hypothetical protein AWU57_294 [Marinobacter sp. T13-3]|nr:MAG: hypothetical protein AWU57_294 [Marinobacter sp. T13-3]